MALLQGLNAKERETVYSAYPGLTPEASSRLILRVARQRLASRARWQQQQAQLTPEQQQAARRRGGYATAAGMSPEARKQRAAAAARARWQRHAEAGQ